VNTCSKRLLLEEGIRREKGTEGKEGKGAIVEYIMHWQEAYGRTPPALSPVRILW